MFLFFFLFFLFFFGGGFFIDYLEILPQLSLCCLVFSMVHGFSVGIFIAYSGPSCILGSGREHNTFNAGIRRRETCCTFINAHKHSQ